VELQDDIIVMDAETGAEIWRKDYYQFKAPNVYADVLKHFADKKKA
jgi:hypothetical protein